jgi:hypothetical protein
LLDTVTLSPPLLVKTTLSFAAKPVTLPPIVAEPLPPPPHPANNIAKPAPAIHATAFIRFINLPGFPVNFRIHQAGSRNGTPAQFWAKAQGYY